MIGEDSLTLADPRLDFSETIGKTTVLERPQGFRCPADPALYSEGKHSYTETNVATLKGGNVDLKADAAVTVNCTLPKLQAAKTAAGSYDRKVEWSLAKSVSPASHSGNAGEGAGSSDWKVTATKSETFVNYKVSGKITVTNPPRSRSPSASPTSSTTAARRTSAARRAPSRPAAASSAPTPPLRPRTRS